MQESMQKYNETPDLFDYLQIIGMRKRSIILATVAAFMLSSIFAFFLPNKYESTTKILPPQQDQGLLSMMMGQIGGMASISSSLLGTGTPADMYASILSSEAIKDTIIDRFKLMEVYDENYRLDMYKKIDKIVEINVGKKDGIISIAVEDEEPKRAADIANAYVDELEKLTVTLNISGAGRNRAFFEERLAKAKADLVRAEESLKAFQSRSKALDVTEQAKATIGGIAQLQAQLVVQETQLAALRSRFTDASQEVLDLKASIANLKYQIAQLEGKGTGSSVIPAGSVPQIGQDYVRLMREFKVQETLVELLTKQYEMAKLSEAKDVSTIQVIQKARVPDKKIRPKRATMVIFVTFFTFCASILLILARSYQENLSEDELRKWRRLKSTFTWRQNGN